MATPRSPSPGHRTNPARAGGLIRPLGRGSAGHRLAGPSGLGGHGPGPGRIRLSGRPSSLRDRRGRGCRVCAYSVAVVPRRRSRLAGPASGHRRWLRVITHLIDVARVPVPAYCDSTVGAAIARRVHAGAWWLVGLRLRVERKVHSAFSPSREPRHHALTVGRVLHQHSAYHGFFDFDGRSARSPSGGPPFAGAVESYPAGRVVSIAEPANPTPERERAGCCTVLPRTSVPNKSSDRTRLSPRLLQDRRSRVLRLAMRGVRHHPHQCWTCGLLLRFPVGAWPRSSLKCLYRHHPRATRSTTTPSMFNPFSFASPPAAAAAKAAPAPQPGPEPATRCPDLEGWDTNLAREPLSPLAARRAEGPFF